MKTEFHRITRLPSYVFAEVNKLKARYRDQGHDIIDFGMGNPDIDTESFIVDKLIETVKKPKVKFHISGMDDKIRKTYKKTHPIGTIVTFTYMGLSNKGVPRHANYLRIRK